MYTGKHAYLRPLQPAFIMAGTGEIVTYRELEARNNRLAHLFRNRGMKRLDHYSIFMENNNRYLEACGAGTDDGNIDRGGKGTHVPALARSPPGLKRPHA